MSDLIFLLALGKRIKQLRTQKKLSQQRMAELCDFEKAHLSRLESGKGNPTVLTLRKVSNTLDCHIRDLFVD